MDKKALKNQPMGWNAAREFVRERDNHSCQKCGRKRRDDERQLDVHHMNEEEGKGGRHQRDYKPEELITLCRRCHLNLPHIRERMSKGKGPKK